jgi:hypothetical protein
MVFLNGLCGDAMPMPIHAPNDAAAKVALQVLYCSSVSGLMVRGRRGLPQLLIAKCVSFWLSNLKMRCTVSRH